MSPQKKKGKRQKHQQYGNNNNAKKPKVGRMKPSEVFFASLFSLPFSDLQRSNDSSERSAAFMRDVCYRAGVPHLVKIPSRSDNTDEFYKARAALVLEESRFVLSEALQRRPPFHIPVNLVSHQVRKTGLIALVFRKSEWYNFTSRELYDMRPGGCFQIVPPYGPAVMASIVPMHNWEKNSGNSVSLMVYQELDLQQRMGWRILPVSTLIGNLRQFEACIQPTFVPFMHDILGTNVSSIARVDQDAGQEKQQDDGAKGQDPTAEEEDVIYLIGDSKVPVASETKFFRLATLNPTQERAANAFLEHPGSILSLVQGPPGSGKTTFMVSVIAQSLMRHKTRRILVAAPTNKAITVLASRFVDTMTDDAPFNVVMIGVEDKLVDDSRGDDSFRIASLSWPMRRIFVYTWVESMIKDFQSLQQDICSGTASVSHLEKARNLVNKLDRSIPNLAASSGSSNKASDFVQHLNDEVNTTSDVDTAKLKDLRTISFTELVAALGTIKPSLATTELLATANVIFCTLSTAGSSAMRQTHPVDDLFVDEAAAATEPELFIPFHLYPMRLLAVGDPMQLPPLVSSKDASELGLSKSMHERLMFDCKQEHVMLDIQYRMKPAISAFPSNHFYNGKLTDGPNVLDANYGGRSASILEGKHYSFLQVEGCEQQQATGSYANLDEAKVVITLVRMLRDSSEKSDPFHSPDKLRIITFYQGQVTLLRRMLDQAGLTQVLVATVDSSQGCEADIVILSFVRSNQGTRSAGFLTDDRRMNVALTRARHQLVCIGNAEGTLSQSAGTTLKALVEDAQERKCISKFEVEYSPPTDNNMNETLLRNKEKQIQLHKEIAASKSIDVATKKRSMLTIVSLQKEVLAMKKERLVRLKGPYQVA